MLVPPLSAALDPVAQTLETVLQNAAFAAGCTRYWGDAITAYNTGVDGLNRRYEEAAANNFGQTPRRCGTRSRAAPSTSTSAT